MFFPFKVHSFLEYRTNWMLPSLCGHLLSSVAAVKTTMTYILAHGQKSIPISYWILSMRHTLIWLHDVSYIICSDICLYSKSSWNTQTLSQQTRYKFNWFCVACSKCVTSHVLSISHHFWYFCPAIAITSSRWLSNEIERVRRVCPQDANQNERRSVGRVSSRD